MWKFGDRRCVRHSMRAVMTVYCLNFEYPGSGIKYLQLRLFLNAEDDVKERSLTTNSSHIITLTRFITRHGGLVITTGPGPQCGPLLAGSKGEDRPGGDGFSRSCRGGHGLGGDSLHPDLSSWTSLTPQVQNSPLQQRIEFLQNKGLTEPEIQQALGDAANGTSTVQATQSVPPPAYARPPPQAANYGFTTYAPPPVAPKRDWRDIFVRSCAIRTEADFRSWQWSQVV